MCKPGSVRANHYHLKDWHYMYVLEGKMDYFFFENNLVKFVIFLEKDQIIFTLLWKCMQHFSVSKQN